MYQKISHDVKIAAMALYEHGLLPLEDILACTGFSESTFWHSLKLWRETGDVVRVTYSFPGCPCTLHFDDINYLVELVKHHPTWLLDELLELVHVGISLKKLRRIAKEWDEDKQAEFVQHMSQYEAEEIGFIDETSKDERMGMMACNVVEGSFNAVKFLDFLEHDVVFTTVFTLPWSTFCSCDGQCKYPSQ
ncbi:hypothetical protein BKA82DRAFT_16708 [Pisolithus tinctorius]|uniref:Uncharacterized protein n=1 Tax=Pisolithus tinctorius Marx 270 TaxID=870435 RepID=A0A0C3NQG8_PISTI|nr:hypothetical protein BKA82DRAFT_16708 [Pisolithus tinctorius]KIN97790.1 hypothetical protein M404DRAFT_16708 [Pisolithus tinctorius Marx 270]